MALEPQWSLQNCGGSTRTSFDYSVWVFGQGAQALPVAVGQWVGLYEPQLHSAGQEPRSVAVINHPLQPRAKRHGGEGHPHAQRSMRASSPIRNLATRQPSYWRLDWVLQPPVASSGPEDEDPSPNLRNVQISCMTCAETAGSIQNLSIFLR